jgi:hypothetical protein
VEAALFYQYYQSFSKKPWVKEIELSWVGDYNPKMIATYEALGAQRVKTHITFRYMVNDKAEFIRFKDEIGMKRQNRNKNQQKN